MIHVFSFEPAVNIDPNSQSIAAIITTIKPANQTPPNQSASPAIAAKTKAEPSLGTRSLHPFAPIMQWHLQNAESGWNSWLQLLQIYQL